MSDSAKPYTDDEIAALREGATFQQSGPMIGRFMADKRMLATLDRERARAEKAEAECARIRGELRRAERALDQAAYFVERLPDYGKDSGQAQALRAAERQALKGQYRMPSRFREDDKEVPR